MDAHTASAARGHSHRVVGRAQSLLAGPPVSYSVPQPDPFRKIDHQAGYYPFLTIFQINPERQRRLIPLRLGTLFGAVRPLWGMRRLRQADLGDRRHDHAPFQAAADDLVLGGLSDGNPFQRHLGAAAATPTRLGFVQIGLPDVCQTSPQHGSTRPQSARRPRRSRQDRDHLQQQERSLTGGGGRSHKGKILVAGAVEIEDGGAGPGRIRLGEVPDYSARSLHAFLKTNLVRGATAKDRWLVGIPRRPWRRSRSSCRRQHGRPYRLTLGAPHLL